MIKLRDILKCLGGTSWKYPTLSSKFIRYGYDTTAPRYKRIGNAVYLQGQVKPTAKMALNSTEIPLFTLPVGYRPANDIITLHQGSGTSYWMTRVSSAGVVSVGRARDVGNSSGGYSTIPTTYWMPFSIVFATEDEYPENSSWGGTEFNSDSTLREVLVC